MAQCFEWLLTLSEFLEKEVHMPDFREGVVDWEVDLALVEHDLLRREGLHRGGVAGHGTLDDGLSGGDHASVEIHLPQGGGHITQALKSTCDTGGDALP
jgi:hypothetical protein